MALTSSGCVFTWGYQRIVDRGELGSEEISFSLPCLVEELRGQNVVQITTSPTFNAAIVDPIRPSIIFQSQQISFNNKQHSDVVFMLEGEPIYANTGILSQRSDYFEAMFRIGMRESIEKVVEIPNCSRELFLSVLKYLCLDDFTMRIDQVLELWELADMYQLEGLLLSCLGTLERELCKDKVSKVLHDAELLICPCERLKEMCRNQIVFKAYSAF